MLTTLHALHVDPAAGNLQVVDWDQSLGSLFDLIGEGYSWRTDRNNRVYQIPPWEVARPGRIIHPRWLAPVAGSVLILSMCPLTGEDRSLPPAAVVAYRRELTLEATSSLTLF